MTETEFLSLIDYTLTQIEDALEHAFQSTDIDLDLRRNGHVLEITVAHAEQGASKIILNSQAPLQEIWLAARAGGFHYKHNGAQWIDTRDGTELLFRVSQCLSSQIGTVINL